MTPYPATPAEWEALVTGLVPVVFLAAVAAACWLASRLRHRPGPASVPDDLMTIADVIREPPPKLRVIWHSHGCGCCCDSTGRSIVCAEHGAGLASVTNLSAWEKERHQR